MDTLQQQRAQQRELKTLVKTIFELTAKVTQQTQRETIFKNLANVNIFTCMKVKIRNTKEVLQDTLFVLRVEKNKQ